MDIRRDILWRVYLCFIGVVIICIAILGKVLFIQHGEGEHWRSMSDSLHQRYDALPAERGTIYSEDGQMLSTSMPQFDIYMDLMADGLRAKDSRIYKANIDSFAAAMAAHFGDKTAAEYKKEVNAAYNKNRRYYLLKRKISFADYKAFREFPLVRLGKNKSGVIVEESSRRITPYGLLANRTIGLSREYVDSEGKIKKQNVGLEMSYDSVLTGRDGHRLIRYANGARMPIEGSDIAPEHGRDIFTTLDVHIQDITQNALLKVMEEEQALYGTVIVMEVKTGKVKAIANLGRRPDGSYWEDDNYALRVTEPGSTIKLATLLAVLDKGAMQIDDKIEIGGGRAQVGPRMVTDAERSPKSVVSVREAFAHSSNVGLGKMGLKAFGNDPTEYRNYLKKFHLNERIPVDLMNLPKPLNAPLEKKNGGVMNLVTMSFGYAIQVSPLHTLTLYNAVANNGKMMKPYLVNSVKQNGIVVQQFDPVVLEEQIAKPEVVKIARESLEAVITEGTGRRPFMNIPFPVAGKTGTAHVVDHNINYSHGIYQASFAGYFPANDPQFSAIVVIRTKPHAPKHYGGSLCAPIFREIATKLYAGYVAKKTPVLYAAAKDSSHFNYEGNSAAIRTVYSVLGMPMTDSSMQRTWGSIAADASYQPVLRGAVYSDKLLPDVRGLGLKDAVFLLERVGLKVVVKGRGRVTSQSLEAGTIIKKGQTITIQLG